MAAEPWRVAQISADREPGGASLRGSGYLIRPGRVLTAAHVVAGASAVRVRLDAGQDDEVNVEAESWWNDPDGPQGTDLAVVTIPEDATAGREAGPVRFGRISDGTAVLPVEAYGFPLFKLKDGPDHAGGGGPFRDLEQARGHAPVAANRRQGTLAIYLDDPLPGGSWAGMSGGPVWSAGRIVAVLAEHHLEEGTGRLVARRIDRAYESLPAAEMGRLSELAGLAPAVAALPDVVPTEPDAFLRSAYLAQVGRIGPDLLIGRDKELAEWAEFCAGSEPYAWWRADPWAGKTALASWFVRHPPAGVDVVSFFVTGRLYGQDDANAFLDAMIEQLTVLAPGAHPAPAGARVGAWLTLLESAATHAAERGRRLAVVVDGLDEDAAGAAPVKGKPSIASLLPRHPPPAARFIVTSRANPGLPADLKPADHPLRTCIPRSLPASQVGESIKELAKDELVDLLAGEQAEIDVVGYIAGSGGGLTKDDLSALTEVPAFKLEHILHGVFGRSLSTRASDYRHDRGTDSPERVYLFAHETLRATAEAELGRELARYRRGVQEWVASYAEAGWPADTPGYAIRGYPRLVEDAGEVMLLAALAGQPRRHAFLRQATGSDYAALTEIRAAQNLVAGRDDADLRVLVELAVYRHVLSIRNKSMVADLPAVWARLGRFEHAEALARAMTSPASLARALTGLAVALAQAGDPDRAEALARSVADPDAQARALADLAATLAQAGDLNRAEAVACAIGRPAVQALALAAVIASAAGRRDPDHLGSLTDRAESLALTRPDPLQDRALTDLVVAAGRAGDPARAQDLARALADGTVRAEALARLAGAIAEAGDAPGAEALARTITDQGARSRALTDVAAAIAQAHDSRRWRQLADHAAALARRSTDSGRRAQVLTDLAIMATGAATPARARKLTRVAKAAALAITGDLPKPKGAAPGGRDRAFVEPACAIAVAGDPDSAEELARAVTDPSLRNLALAALGTAIAESGDPDRAEALARTITDGYERDWALAEVAAATAAAGDLDRAETLARVITGPGARLQAQTDLASAAARAGDLNRAEALARAIASPYGRDQALAAMAAAAGRADDLDRGEAAAQAMSSPQARGRALKHLAAVAARAGHLDRAEALANALTGRYARDQAAAGLAAVLADASQPERAESLADTIADGYAKVRAFTALAIAAARSGDHDWARRLGDRAETLGRTISDPAEQSWALAGLATAAAQDGLLERAETLALAGDGPFAPAEARADLARAAARAGDLDRAEALARTISDGQVQGETLTDVVAAMAGAGDINRAEAVARSISSPASRAAGLTTVAVVIAQSGDLAGARALARTIQDPDHYRLAFADHDARMIARLAAALAQTGDLDGAEAIADSLTDLDAVILALCDLAIAAARTGDPARAARLGDQVFTRLGGNPDEPFRFIDHDVRPEALARLAPALGRAGEMDRAEAAAAAVERPDLQAPALADLSVIAARSGDLSRARRLARQARTIDPAANDRTYPDQHARILALGRLAATVTGAEDLDRAEVLARASSPAAVQADTLADLAEMLAQVGDPDRAEAIIATITGPEAQARAFTMLAIAVQPGDHDRAYRLADHAETLISSITDPRERNQALAVLAHAAARAGELDRAEALIPAITGPGTPARLRDDLLASAARAAAQAGDLDRAESLVRRIAHDHYGRDEVVKDVITAMGHAGQVSRATALACTISRVYDQRLALSRLAIKTARTGDLDQAETVARACADSHVQTQVLADLVAVIAQAGDLGRAETLGRAIGEPGERARAMISLVSLGAQADHRDRSRRLADEAETLIGSFTNPYAQASSLADLASAIAQAGDLDRAERLARTISGYGPKRDLDASDGPPRFDYLAEHQFNSTDDLVTAASLKDLINQAHAAEASPADAFSCAAYSAEQIQDKALASVATAAAWSGDLDRAEDLIRTIDEPDAQTAALADLAVAVAAVGDLDRARQLVTRAEALTELSSSAIGYGRPALVAAIARVDKPDRAVALARAIVDAGIQVEVLAKLAAAMAEAGDLDQAESIARVIADSDRQARVLAELAHASIGDAAKTRQLADRAEALALTVASPESQGTILGDLAAAVAETGDLDQAGRRLARAITTGPPGLWWTGTMALFFPSILIQAWDVLVGAYSAPGTPPGGSP